MIVFSYLPCQRAYNYIEPIGDVFPAQGLADQALGYRSRNQFCTVS